MNLVSRAGGWRKSFCVLDQGDLVDDALALEKKRLFTTPFSDYYRLNWRAAEDPHADFALHGSSLFSEGRCVLLALVPRIYGYYIFVDDDVVFYDGFGEEAEARSRGTIPRKIAAFFDEYRPLTGTFYNPNDWTQAHLDRGRLAREIAVPIKAYDITACFYHAGVLDHLFPVPYHGTFGIFWFQQYLVHETHPRKQMCFAGVSVRNTAHRGHPEDAMPRKLEAMDLFNGGTHNKNFDYREGWSNAAVREANAELSRCGQVAKEEAAFSGSDVARAYDVDIDAYRNRRITRHGDRLAVPGNASCRYAAFNGDCAVTMLVGRLVQAYDIRLAIETGTFRGRTTQFLARICESVRTAELDEATLGETRKRLSEFLTNILFAHGKADEILRSKWLNAADADALPGRGNLLFYLDAHWREDWPLRSELAAIGERPDVRDRALIIVDDFKTPARAFGYDRYAQGECSLDYVADILANSYSATHELVFLGHTSFADESAAVGKLFLVPKSWGKLNEWTSRTVHTEGAFTYRFTTSLSLRQALT